MYFVPVVMCPETERSPLRVIRDLSPLNDASGRVLSVPGPACPFTEPIDLHTFHSVLSDSIRSVSSVGSSLLGY